MTKLTTDTKRVLKLLQIIVQGKYDKRLLNNVLEQGQYGILRQELLNKLRTKHIEQLRELYDTQLQIDNSQNPCGETIIDPWDEQFNEMFKQANPKPSKFKVQKPTHSVPLTMGGTSGIIPNQNKPRYTK